ncbi:RnfABCDGE type electron transport complex subunit G [Diplocloster modestus]|uniref:Ion-translocating oxidoreductase complex subunit G n=1 Tax=Diplocloster modestus TaxID=2850322 RepID=A0ABS6K8T4_9FIRM|nr:RnfABCDGE type electron transport complex subunit G [Diplocloster modestus]MBU9726935.1 RnfABCDGE type electron transport complex subunit G [Diplocloster modestus]
MNRIVKDTIILTVITLVAGVLLGLVYEVTKDPIAVQKELKKQEAYKTVFSDAEKFEQAPDTEDASAKALVDGGFNSADAEKASIVINETMKALDAGGNVLGYAMNITTTQGYGGDITFTLGIRNDGTVNGYEILSISETAGLGMKAKEDAFKQQFSGKKVDSFAYTKTGASADNEIDAISGATITTKAMTDAINAGLCWFQTLEGGSVNE